MERFGSINNAGINDGDIILEINGQPIKMISDVQNQLTNVSEDSICCDNQFSVCYVPVHHRCSMLPMT